jgi:hypothetical protein
VNLNPVGDLKLGWRTTDPAEIWDQLKKPMKLAGLAITVIAIGMGAPFWNDVLKRLAARKDEGPKPDTR